MERVHGGRGVGSKNGDGERVLDLAVAHDLAICSTSFAKRESQKMTYSSGGRRTEVDHILVRRRALKTVRDVKVLPIEDVATQHRPLVADLNVILPIKVKVKTETRIRWWKLRRPERSELKRRVVAAGRPNPDGPVNETWRLATRTILQCAKDLLGETKGGQKGDRAAWFRNDEVQKAVREKKNAFKTWQMSRLLEDLAKYKEYKRRAKMAVSRAKTTEMDSLYEKLEQSQAEKFAFRLAKARHLDVRVVRAVKSATGSVLRAKVEVKSRWEEYFKGLLNEEFPRESVRAAEPVEGPMQLWTEGEVQKAGMKMKIVPTPWSRHVTPRNVAAKTTQPLQNGNTSALRKLSLAPSKPVADPAAVKRNSTTLAAKSTLQTLAARRMSTPHPTNVAAPSSRRANQTVIKRAVSVTEQKRDVTLKPQVSTSSRPSLIKTGSIPQSQNLPKMAALEKPRPLRRTTENTSEMGRTTPRPKWV
ncbi:unnamed protein product [Nippostrongylus brasiliensis]|uniref:Reverse transcriptase domain-containing protein n=1 Tax=Nippostrongylus brasiliensis TaxID=27835 RepID=A0A0N4Y9T3_NIPBR|nr:unnamed protein product [Nippostrongylus brasiliensis]